MAHDHYFSVRELERRVGHTLDGVVPRKICDPDIRERLQSLFCGGPYGSIAQQTRQKNDFGSHDSSRIFHRFELSTLKSFEVNGLFAQTSEYNSYVRERACGSAHSMHIDFLGLQAFVAIAERGSFQQAAAHLNLSQTALSHRIRKLEEDLGVKLLFRTTREVSVTQAGLKLLPEVREILDSLAVSLDELRRDALRKEQILSIGCLPTVASERLPEAVQLFHARHPNVVLRIYDNSAGEISDLVQMGKIAFGITFVAAQRRDLNIETLIKDPFTLLCPKEHTLASQTIVSWSDLHKEPLVRVGARTGNRMAIDDELGSSRENFVWRFEVQHVQTAISLVRARLALAVIPRLAVGNAEELGLTLVPLRNPSITRQLGIVSKRLPPLSPLAAELRKIVVDTLTNAKNKSVSRRPLAGKRGMKNIH
jgi:DNA-binding transcriptional LysR family regulator